MEGRHCFGHLTVEENLLTGAYTRRDGAAASRSRPRAGLRLLPAAEGAPPSQAGYTSGGEQQMCAIGRALMARPRLILLDEPSMGLAPQLVEEIFEIVARLNARGRASPSCSPSRTPTSRLRYADYGYILENGRVVLDGDAAALRSNEDVKEFYLGLSSAGGGASATSRATSGASGGFRTSTMIGSRSPGRAWRNAPVPALAEALRHDSRERAPAGRRSDPPDQRPVSIDWHRRPSAARARSTATRLESAHSAAALALNSFLPWRRMTDRMPLAGWVGFGCRAVRGPLPDRPARHAAASRPPGRCARASRWR